MLNYTYLWSNSRFFSVGIKLIVSCYNLQNTLKTFRFVLLSIHIMAPSWLECIYLSNTTLFDGRDMYRNLLHKEQLHVSALDIGHLQVEKWKNSVSSYTRLVCVVYSGEIRGEMGTSSRMCCVGWVVWVHRVLLLYAMSRLIELDLRYHLVYLWTQRGWQTLWRQKFNYTDYKPSNIKK